MLLRIARRGASWESTNVAEVCETEFADPDRDGLDLQPSVYRLDNPSRVLQTHVEHNAGGGADPPRAKKHVDVESLVAARLDVTPGNPGFVFTRDAHRQLALESEDQVRELVAELLADVARRQHPTENDPMRAYVRDRIDLADSEWTTFCATAPKWKKWAGR